MHLCVTKAGMIFVDSESCRQGFASLLNKFQEGVCLIDEKTNEIIFQNRAASNGLKFDTQLSQSMLLEQTDGNSSN